MSDLLIVTIIIIAIGVMFVVIEYLSWLSDLGKTTPRISFSSFKTFYALYPTKWTLRDAYVVYNDRDECIAVDFKHFYDVIKYRIFINKKTNDKIKLDKIKNEKDFINLMQLDINAYREESINKIKNILEV